MRFEPTCVNPKPYDLHHKLIHVGSNLITTSANPCMKYKPHCEIQQAKLIRPNRRSLWDPLGKAYETRQAKLIGPNGQSL